MTHYCPIRTPERVLCDRPAFYLVQGTALCRDHARDAVAEFAPTDSQPPAPAEEASTR